jgi:hypothetical protein
MLKFCELDQISFLDEVVAGAWTMWLAQGITVEVWTKVEYVLNHRRGFRYRTLPAWSFVIP